MIFVDWMEVRKFLSGRPFGRSVRILFLKRKADMENSWGIKMAAAFPGSSKSSFVAPAFVLSISWSAQENHMLVIIIGMREDSEVYDAAQKRIRKHGL